MAKKIFIIAGEPSGDALGAKLMKELRQQAGEPIEFRGIGGPHMEAQGFKSLLPMSELSVMGVWEVMAQLPRLLGLIRQVVENIEKYQPDAILTVDLPDFNFEVARRIKKHKKCSNTKIIHYVAPSVWAWRPKRAQKIARYVDALICLFPFEPAYFTKHKLRAEFVGHPIVETHPETGNGMAFRRGSAIPDGAPTLGLFFGSRMGEFHAMGEVLKDSARMVKEQIPGLQLIIPTMPHLEYEILKLIEGLHLPAFVLKGAENKWDAFAACDAAIAVSGTVALELAYVGVPHVITYRTNPMTWMIVKQMVKLKHVHLGNILLNEGVYPEFLQGKSDPLLIGKELMKLYKVEEKRGAQKEKAGQIRAILGANEAQSPSAKAADFVLRILNGR